MGWEDTFRPLQLAAFQGRELTVDGDLPHLVVDGGPPVAAGWLAAVASLSPNHRFMWHVVRYAVGWSGGRAAERGALLRDLVGRSSKRPRPGGRPGHPDGTAVHRQRAGLRPPPVLAAALAAAGVAVETCF